MTLVQINVADVLGRAPEYGDKIIFRTKRIRGSDTNLDQVLVPREQIVPLVSGVAEVEVDPGQALVQFRCGTSVDTNPIEVFVPRHDEPISLRALLEKVFQYDEPVVSAVTRLVEEARRITSVLGSAEQIEQWVAEADEDAKAADRAATSAAQAAATAASGVPDATTSAKGKVQLAGDLAGTADAPTVPKLASKADLVGGQVPTSQLPAVALVKPNSVTDRAGMLALAAQEGDVAVIASGADKGTYMLGAGSPASFNSWLKLVTPDAPVQAVNGQTGTVNLNAANVGAAPASHTHTVAQVTGLQSALDGKTPATEVESGDTPSPSKIPRRTNTNQLQTDVDPVLPNDLARKSYVDSKTFGTDLLYGLKLGSGMTAWADTIPRSTNWGSAVIGLETSGPYNHPQAWITNYLRIIAPGTWQIDVMGSRGSGAGTMKCTCLRNGTETDLFTWTETGSVSKTATVTLQQGDQIGLRWVTSGGSNQFNYRVTITKL